MAWTAPMTFAGNTILTAAQLNTYVRDNMLMLAPAKSTTESSYFVADAANSVVERIAKTARVSTSETTTSVAYAALATAGPAVTVTTGTDALILHGCNLQNNTGDASAVQSWAISGATTRAAQNSTAVNLDGVTAANACQLYDVDLMQGLTAGSNTFTCQYLVSAGTGTFADRFIAVMPL